MNQILSFDPGKNTGLATFNGGKLTALETIRPHEIERTIRALKPVAVIFEDSRLQSHTWTKGKSAAASAKMARNVGQVDAWCMLIAEVCHELQIPALGISPGAKGAKVDAAAFRQITGWDEPSNEHTRDAAMVGWRYRNGFGSKGA